MAIRVPGQSQSNQVGEIAAIIKAIESVPLSQPLEIISDSRYAIDGLTTHLQTWEDHGWIGIENAQFFHKAAYLLRRRTATTAFQWVKGHNGVEGNKQSDQLAREGAANPNPDVLDLNILDNFNVQGAKISSLTQALAYKGILERKPVLICQSSTENIEQARVAIKRLTGNDETDATIWMSMKKAPICPKIRQFLFKATHEVFKIGHFWSRIPNVAERHLCTTCGITESISHILIHCRSRPTRLIWRLAKGVWPHTNIPWPETDLGMILGCGCISVSQAIANPRQALVQNQKSTHLRGASHLLKILVSESAFLIWAL